MAAQAQIGTVALAHLLLALHRQVRARADQRSGSTVFKATITVAHGKRHEHVALHRRAPTGRLEKADLRLADFLQVGTQARHVEVGHLTGDDDVMRHAMGLEGRQREAAKFDRVIDQFVIVGCDIAAETVALGVELWQRGGDAPGGICRTFGAADLDFMRRLLLARHAKEDAGAVEECMGLVEMGGAHRQVPCVDLIHQDQRPVAAGGLPAVLVGFFKRDLSAISARRDAHDVARELTNHVAARYPCRQHQALAGRVRRLYRQRHFEQVCGWVFGDDAVAYGMRHALFHLMH